MKALNLELQSQLKEGGRVGNKNSYDHVPQSQITK